MEIKNKVKESGIIQLDLADFKPKNELVGIDLSERLYQGLILKEKDFRLWLKENNWQQYEGKAVFIYCSAEAIIPTWAYMLVVSMLMPYTEQILAGTRIDLEKKMIQDNIVAMDLSTMTDQRVIIKGCSDIASPEFAMSELVRMLQPVVKSIMYGEPCSTVPIFKKKKL